MILYKYEKRYKNSISFINYYNFNFRNQNLLVGSGNGWVCQDGIWIKRGNHNKPIPAEDCGDIQNEPTITYHNASEDLIQIESPLPDANVNQEFNITGQARGYWFLKLLFQSRS